MLSSSSTQAHSHVMLEAEHYPPGVTDNRVPGRPLGCAHEREVAFVRLYPLDDSLVQVRVRGVVNQQVRDVV